MKDFVTANCVLAYKIRHSLYLAVTKAVSVPDTSRTKNAFQILGRDKSFTVWTETSEEKVFFTSFSCLAYVP